MHSTFTNNTWGDYVNEPPGSALLFPLSIRINGSDKNLVRTILSINEEEKSMTFAGNCDVAENGLIALTLVQTNDYDMVLMDLQMPEMDGYQTTTAIRQLPGEKYKNLPILALTASAMLDIKDKAFTLGMNDYISKPFNPNDLYRKIAFHANLIEG